MSQDLYDILGVSKDSSDDEIKKAYRKLSKQYHPDLNKGDTESEKKFKEVSAAYEVLSDKQKRAQYDQFGGVPGSGGFGTGGGFQGGGFDFSGFGNNFSDIFESFFSGQGGGAHQQRERASAGSDLETTIHLSFEEAVFGCAKEVSIPRLIQCKDCNGQGTEKGSSLIDCKECHGTGEITTIQNTFLGQMRSSKVCPNCHGKGKVPEKACTSCQGEGRLKESSQIKINIPAGVESGTTLRLTGQGNAGAQGHPTGNLYVHVTVKPSSKFERYGYDIRTKLVIHLVQAVLGDEVDIDTIHGKVSLKIPAGTASNTTLRLRGHGVQKINSENKGDHLIDIEVEIPKKISGEEKDLYKQLGEIAKKKGKGIWGKLFS